MNAMNKHLGNISRVVGHDVTNKYSYVVNSNDLTNAYVKMKDELGYPLMIDSKYRRAIVYNKKGLQKKIENVIDNCIINNISLLDRIVVEDIVSQLNSITQSANGMLSVGKKNSSNISAINMFANSMLKGVLKGVENIIDDIVNQKDER